MSVRAPAAAPTPMPAFVSVERPFESAFALAVVDALGTETAELVGMPVDEEVAVEAVVALVVEELEVVDRGAPNVCARIIAAGLLSGVQQSVVSPQHHFSDVRVPSQGVT